LVHFITSKKYNIKYNIIQQLCEAKLPILFTFHSYLKSGNENLREERRKKREEIREQKQNDNLLSKIVVSFWCS